MTVESNDEKRAYDLETALTSIQAQMQEVERRLQRAALQGGISGESIRQCKMLLKDSAERLDYLPLARR